LIKFTQNKFINIDLITSVAASISIVSEEQNLTRVDITIGTNLSSSK
jgi:hypothetical protein